ncbi:hypothetical protein V1289_006969 [Bradyrhizobium sp. AZCC 2289]
MPKPFGMCRLAAHDPGHVAGIEEQRVRVDVGGFVRNQEQRSIGDLPAGALAAERHCHRAVGPPAAGSDRPEDMPTLSASPSRPPSLFGAALHGGRDRGDIGNVDHVGKGLAAFGCDPRHRVVGGLPVYVDAGDRRAFACEQHRHRPPVADRRLLIDDFALAGADHDDAAAFEPAVAPGKAQRFRVQRGGGIDLFRRVRGGGQGLLPRLLFFVFRHCEPTGRANARPMINSAKQSIRSRSKNGLLRRGVYHRAGQRPDPLAPRNDGNL